MKLRLFLLLLVATMWPALASNAATLTGVVVNGNSGSPVSGATVLLRDHNAQATTNFNGQFRLSVPDNTEGVLLVNCDGFEPFAMDIATVQGTINVGEIRITTDNFGEDFYGDASDLVFDETALDDDEGASQNIASLTGSNDNLYYNTASYNFGLPL
ncbi:MAG: carboxypeptidase-like regulatory domain-containing protein, partial [Muribaculaceae bacterium]|nr:carboxypeptidase-like regulatory domain-containing protein [Muribaculaceae bacterium]